MAPIGGAESRSFVDTTVCPYENYRCFKLITLLFAIKLYNSYAGDTLMGRRHNNDSQKKDRRGLLLWAHGGVLATANPPSEMPAPPTGQIIGPRRPPEALGRRGGHTGMAIKKN